MKRVVVTGMAGITSLGSDWASIEANFVAGRSGIRRMDEWDRFTELNTRLAGPVDDFAVPAHWTRKQLRSMGRVSRMAVGAAELALQDAGLLGNPIIRDGRMGVACGSSTGSTEDIKAFGNMLLNSVADGLNANSYVRMMPHTTAANISIFFGLTGRLIPTSAPAPAVARASAMPTRPSSSDACLLCWPVVQKSCALPKRWCSMRCTPPA